MKKAVDMRIISNEVNDSIIKSIESLIEDFANRWFYQIVWNWFISDEIKEEIELWWYLITKLQWNRFIISRRKIKWDKI